MSVPQYRLSQNHLQKYEDFALPVLRAVMSKRAKPFSHSTELLHPHISCFKATTGKFCRNPDCKQHGNWERHRRATEWARFDPSKYDTYSLSLAIGGYVTKSQYLAVRQHFRASVKKKLSGHGYKDYCFRTEFEQVIPHLHWLFRLPLGSDFNTVAQVVRQCWKEAMSAIGIWRSQHVGCVLMGKSGYDNFKHCDYIYSTNYNSWNINNCRPREWCDRSTRLTYRSRGWADMSIVQTAEQAEAEIIEGLALDCIAAPLRSAASPDSLRSPDVDTLEASPVRKQTVTTARSFTGCTVTDYCIRRSGVLLVRYSPTFAVLIPLRVLSLQATRECPAPGATEAL